MQLVALMYLGCSDFSEWKESRAETQSVVGQRIRLNICSLNLSSIGLSGYGTCI